jgi:hypothetical protein
MRRSHLVKGIRTTIAGGVAVALAGSALGQSEPVNEPSPWKLSALLDLGGVYDSNIDRDASNEKDDFFFDAGVGVRAVYSVPDFDASGLGFAHQRAYAETSRKNFSGFGEVLKLSYGAPEDLVFGVYQSFRRVEDVDAYGEEVAGIASHDAFLNADVRRERDICEAGGTVGAAFGDKRDLKVGYGFNQTEDRSGNLLDITTHAAQIEGAQRLTDRSAGLFTLLGSLQESENVDDMGVYKAARLGLTTRRTDRITLKAGAGYQVFDHPDSSEVSDAFHYDGQASWRATDKTVLRLSARNGVQLSSLYDGNVVDFTVIRLGVTTQMTDAFALSLSGVYRVDDYHDPVVFESNTVHRRDEGIAAVFRVDYALPPKQNLRVFAEVSQETMDSTTRDYAVTRAGAGVQLRL